MPKIICIVVLLLATQTTQVHNATWAQARHQIHLVQGYAPGYTHMPVRRLFLHASAWGNVVMID